jgi:dihydrofolate reductase
MKKYQILFFIVLTCSCHSTESSQSITNDPIDLTARDTSVRPQEAFVAIKKMIVFSKSLDNPEGPEGEKTSIVRTSLRDEILTLKQEQGKNILTGGVNLSLQLAELGLIDEFHIVVHPIVLGEGSTVFKSGAVVLRYLKP